jgi:hypothetical protein
MILIRVTNCCRMGCSHCMIRATPDGEHMSLHTFAKCLEFAANTINLPLLMLSGGEPTEHPQINELIDLAKSVGMSITLLSNGMFLSEWEPEKRDELIDKVEFVQVTNDPRFYPQSIPSFEHPKVFFEDTLRIVSPMGRAKDNGLETNRQAPLCFNLRSATRSLGNIVSAIFHLRGLGKMCTPSVNVDGSIVAGESPSCYKIGTVENDELKLTQNLINMTCSNCGLVNNLSQEHKRIIGEARIIL